MSNMHKRKRSLQDTPVDLSKMRMALNRLTALKEELDGIEETEKEMDSVMEHVNALEEILSRAKKPKVSFSAMKEDDLAKLGIERKLLAFCPDKLTFLVQQLISKASGEINLLRDRILEIYNRVNMDYEPGSRMILDAVLLTLARIVYDEQSKSEVAILPEMRIAPGDGVQLINPASGYEIWLSGSVDYAVVQYKDERDRRERLLGVGGVRRERDVFKISEGRLFLVEAKRTLVNGVSALASHMPEAVGQALALANTTKRKEVRFCLSNGQTWIFCILKLEGDQWTYYESATRQLSKEVLTISNKAICEIVQLVLEWLVPSVNDLYVLDE